MCKVRNTFLRESPCLNEYTKLGGIAEGVVVERFAGRGRVCNRVELIGNGCRDCAGISGNVNPRHSVTRQSINRMYVDVKRMTSIRRLREYFLGAELCLK